MSKLLHATVTVNQICTLDYGFSTFNGNWMGSLLRKFCRELRPAGRVSHKIQALDFTKYNWWLSHRAVIPLCNIFLKYSNATRSMWRALRMVIPLYYLWDGKAVWYQINRFIRWLLILFRTRLKGKLSLKVCAIERSSFAVAQKVPNPRRHRARRSTMATHSRNLLNE